MTNYIRPLTKYLIDTNSQLLTFTGFRVTMREYHRDLQEDLRRRPHRKLFGKVGRLFV